MFLPERLAKLVTLKVGTSSTVISVLDGPFVLYTEFGYIPVLHVQVEKSGIDYLLPIAARSLARPLNEILMKHPSFKGLRISINKASDEKTSRYQVSLA